MKKEQKIELEKEYKDLDDKKVIEEFTFALTDFSEKADKKMPLDHRSYVYALCERDGDSLIPFYIGEGKGARVWSHEVEETSQIELLKKELEEEGREEEFEEEKELLKNKIKKIHDIKERGGEIVKYIIKWGMTSKEAFMAESALINLLQIGGLKFDSKYNEELTNIVKGHQSEGEKQTGKTEARSVEDFCNEFAKDPLYFEDLQKDKVKAVLININRAYPECLKHTEGSDRNIAIRDSACGDWSMSINSFEKAGIDYVFATVRSRIIGIYRIKEVGGKKFHNMYECVNPKSEYPHGKNTVRFRNSDYDFAESVENVAKAKGIEPSELVLDDMDKDIITKFQEENKTYKDAQNAFKNALKRVYMILEDLSETDPNYDKFTEYLHRRVIHTEEYVTKRKTEKTKEREKAIKEGKKDKLPNPDSVTNKVYGSGNPIKRII